jgi:hypothetical protein
MKLSKWKIPAILVILLVLISLIAVACQPNPTSTGSNPATIPPDKNPATSQPATTQEVANPDPGCFNDDFSSPDLSKGWVWTDPLGDSNYSLNNRMVIMTFMPRI